VVVRRQRQMLRVSTLSPVSSCWLMTLLNGDVRLYLYLGCLSIIVANNRHESQRDRIGDHSSRQTAAGS
jgi:hypothetical protein